MGFTDKVIYAQYVADGLRVGGPMNRWPSISQGYSFYTWLRLDEVCLPKEQDGPVRRQLFVSASHFIISALQFAHLISLIIMNSINPYEHIAASEDL